MAGKDKRAALVVAMMKGKPPEKAEEEGDGPSAEHEGIAKDLHDGIHGHDMAKIAEAIAAIHALASKHSEPDGDEAVAEPEGE